MANHVHSCFMGGGLHSSLAKRRWVHRFGLSGFDLALGQALGRGDFP
ncbi:MAG: hypothetical protein ACPGR8_08490 [Limisphaerales bacterium]